MKFPTDEQLIDMLRKIAEYCSETCCIDCKFSNNGRREECLFKNLGNELSSVPRNWKIAEIERIVEL